jgi:hypothetical protein
MYLCLDGNIGLPVSFFYYCCGICSCQNDTLYGQYIKHGNKNFRCVDKRICLVHFISEKLCLDLKRDVVGNISLRVQLKPARCFLAVNSDILLICFWNTFMNLIFVLLSAQPEM